VYVESLTIRRVVGMVQSQSPTLSAIATALGDAIHTNRDSVAQA
jgi:hypothetical protein